MLDGGPALERLDDLGRQAHRLAARQADSERQGVEALIDAWVGEAFGLSEEERSVLEGRTSEAPLRELLRAAPPVTPVRRISARNSLKGKRYH